MKHGDIIQEADWLHWWPKWKRYPRLQYRFRYDPVPLYINNYHRGCWCKRPHHMNEEKQFYACDPKLVRGKRHPRHLPDPWDDHKRSDLRDKRSWKKGYRVRKQWMKHIAS